MLAILIQISRLNQHMPMLTLTLNADHGLPIGFPGNYLLGNHQRTNPSIHVSNGCGAVESIEFEAFFSFKNLVCNVL